MQSITDRTKINFSKNIIELDPIEVKFDSRFFVAIDNNKVQAQLDNLSEAIPVYHLTTSKSLSNGQKSWFLGPGGVGNKCTFAIPDEISKISKELKQVEVCIHRLFWISGSMYVYTTDPLITGRNTSTLFEQIYICK